MIYGIELTEKLMTNQAGLFKLSFISFLCATTLLSASCNSQPDDSANEKIALSDSERFYQGFIVSGFMWDVYVANLDDLNNSVKRYRLRFNRDEFKYNSLVNRLHGEGVKIDWPSRVNKSSVVRAKFIAIPAEPFGANGRGIAVEIDNKLFVRKVISCSSDLTSQSSRAWPSP